MFTSTPHPTPVLNLGTCYYMKAVCGHIHQSIWHKRPGLWLSGHALDGSIKYTSELMGTLIWCCSCRWCSITHIVLHVRAVSGGVHLQQMCKMFCLCYKCKAAEYLSIWTSKAWGTLTWFMSTWVALVKNKTHRSDLLIHLHLGTSVALVAVILTQHWELVSIWDNKWT